MITQFALRLTFGMTLMWLLMPRRDVTAGFFKIQMRVVLGLCVLALLAFPTDTNAILSTTTCRVLCGIAGGVAYFGSVFWLYDWRRAATWAMAPIALLTGSVLMVAYGYPGGTGEQRVWLQPLSEFSSSALLGSTVVGMLLGHWYLTSPTMTIRPLSFLNHCVLGCAVLRLIVAAIGLWVGYGLLQTSTHSIWLGMRWAAAIACPIGVWFLVWRILKYKNTQSATGVLFAGVIVTFIGEMTAMLLSTEVSWPL